MGWGNCGEDSKGRSIGYNVEAVCDHPGCNEKIDRGLAYVCGDMHGSDEYSCEGYFCDEHRDNCVSVADSRYISVCNNCAVELLLTEDWIENEDGEIQEQVE